MPTLTGSSTGIPGSSPATLNMSAYGAGYLEVGGVEGERLHTLSRRPARRLDLANVCPVDPEPRAERRSDREICGEVWLGLERQLPNVGDRLQGVGVDANETLGEVPVCTQAQNEGPEALELRCFNRTPGWITL